MSDSMPAWIDFCQVFHQDVFVIYNSLEAAVLDAVRPFDAEQRASVARELENLINSSMSDEEVQNRWEECGVQIGPGRGTTRDMLEEILNIVVAAGS
jgi:CdiI immunity protein